MNTTIVTGFIDLCKHVKDTKNTRALSSDYHGYAKNFTLKLPVPLYCFVEPESVDIVRNIRNDYGYEHITVVKSISFDTLFLYPFLSDIGKNYNIHSDKPSVGPYCPEYLVVVNGKADMLKRVSRDNPFKSKYLIWLDYGIIKRGYNDVLDLLDIYTICMYPKYKPCFAIIDRDCNLSLDELMFGWKWIAACGLITIPIDHCTNFVEDWMKKCVEMVDKGLYPLEESICYSMWKEYPERYNVFYANYDTLGTKYFTNSLPEQAKDVKSRILHLDPKNCIEADKKGLYRVELLIKSLFLKFGLNIIYKRPIILNNCNKKDVCDYIEMILFGNIGTKFRYGLEENIFKYCLYEQIVYLFNHRQDMLKKSE